MISSQLAQVFQNIASPSMDAACSVQTPESGIASCQKEHARTVSSFCGPYGHAGGRASAAFIELKQNCKLYRDRSARYGTRNAAAMPRPFSFSCAGKELQILAWLAFDTSIWVRSMGTQLQVNSRILNFFNFLRLQHNRENSTYSSTPAPLFALLLFACCWDCKIYDSRKGRKNSKRKNDRSVRPALLS